jgi:thioredoxin-like negative regulator of GroEL
VPVSKEQRADAGAPRTGPALTQGRPVMIEFSRDHCPPCDIMEPWVEAVKVKYAGKLDVAEINIDRPGNKELQKFFEVRAIPSIVFLDARGRIAGRLTGLSTQVQMERVIDRKLFSRVDG